MVVLALDDLCTVRQRSSKLSLKEFNVDPAARSPPRGRRGGGMRCSAVS